MNPNFLTLWHGAVAILADASVRAVDASTADMAKFDIVANTRGGAWLLSEKSDLFNWPGICGIFVKVRESHGLYSFENVNKKRVCSLVLSTAPLFLRGFPMEVQKEVFRIKVSELGEIQMWPFGDIPEVRENVSLNMSNVFTNETMLFHYDGVFKTVKNEMIGEWMSVPPMFPMFRNRAANKKMGNLTVFLVVM